MGGGKEHKKRFSQPIFSFFAAFYLGLCGQSRKNVPNSNIFLKSYASLRGQGDGGSKFWKHNVWGFKGWGIEWCYPFFFHFTGTLQKKYLFCQKCEQRFADRLKIKSLIFSFQWYYHICFVRTLSYVKKNNCSKIFIPRFAGRITIKCLIFSFQWYLYICYVCTRSDINEKNVFAKRNLSSAASWKIHGIFILFQRFPLRQLPRLAFWFRNSIEPEEKCDTDSGRRPFFPRCRKQKWIVWGTSRHPRTKPITYLESAWRELSNVMLSDMSFTITPSP